MKVRRPIMPNWSTTMLAGMFVTKPEKREILRFRANHDDENSQTIWSSSPESHRTPSRKKGKKYIRHKPSRPFGFGIESLEPSKRERRDAGILFSIFSQPQVWNCQFIYVWYPTLRTKLGTFNKSGTVCLQAIIWSESSVAAAIRNTHIVTSVGSLQHWEVENCKPIWKMWNSYRYLWNTPEYN